MVDHDLQRLGAFISSRTLRAWHKGVRALFNKACSSNPDLTTTRVYELVLCHMSCLVVLTSRDEARLRHVLIDNKDLSEEDVVDWLIRFKYQTPLLDALESLINRAK